MKGENAELANQTNQIEESPIFEENLTFSDCVVEIHKQIQNLFE